MDPYRPNPYGGYQQPPPGVPNPYGRPPPMNQGPPPGYGGPAPMRPPYGGPPPMQSNFRPPGGPFMPGPPGMAAHGPPLPESDKLTTLFVGAIAPGISDAWIETLLKECGNLNKWKRLRDQTGKPKGFGFAEYADADSVLRALRVLGGEAGSEGVTLQALDGSGIKKKLIVKADDNVRRYLDQYQQSRPATPQDQELDTNAETAVRRHVEAMLTSAEPGSTEEREPSESDEQQRGMNDGTMQPTDDISAEQKEVISKEIAYFRERATQREQEKRRREEERQKEIDRAEAERRERESPFAIPSGPSRHNGHHLPRQSFVRESGHDDAMMDIDDEEEFERKRQEKREHELEAAFRERERRWEQREAKMARIYEREANKELEMAEREKQDREAMAFRLCDWNDDKQAEVEDFYRNRDRWLARRRVDRDREAQADERDRRREQEEIEEQKRREDEEIRIGKGLAVGAKITPIHTKLSLGKVIKRRANLVGGEDDEDDDDVAKKKKRVLVPLDYGELEHVDNAAGNPEERKKKVKELIDSIPASQEGLWNWHIKWDELDHDTVEKKLRPFVSKKIVELLGVQEDELTQFVLDFIRKRQPPSALAKELEMALDEEAGMFVMKLWRMIIFETESRAKRL